MNSKLKNIAIISSLIIILTTLIFFFTQNISSEYFIEVAEIFLTILIISSISIGIVIKRKLMKFKSKNIKKLLVFLIVFGTSFIGLYLYYINELNSFKTLAFDKIMSISVGLFSLALLLKIKYDLDNNVA